jgi:hypothetical protein
MVAEEEARIITCPRIPIAISKSIIKPPFTAALAATSTTCRPLRNSTSWPHACLRLHLLLHTSIINTTRTITPTRPFTIRITTTTTIRITTTIIIISWPAIL